VGTFTNPYDVTKPLASDLASGGDDQIRSDKAALLERMLVEHDFPTAAGAGSGRHKLAFGDTASRPTDIVAGTPYFNTETLFAEIWDGAQWVAFNPAAVFLALSGGTMTGEIVFPNTLGIRGKETGGTDRRLLAMSSLNRTELGNTVNILNLLGPGDINHFDGASNRKVWDSGNDGSGSGLDADLIKGVALSLLSSNNTNGYLFFAVGYPFIQWGRNSVGAGSSLLVTLPVAYPNAHYVAVGCLSNALPNPQDNVFATPHDLTRVALVNQGTGPISINWISIGR
jgi:hypothetical protein